MGSQVTRNRIVEEADVLFYQQGFDHTSFADIAQSVGISKGNFYYHFKTKDEVLSAVIDFRLERTQNMLREWEIDQPPEARIKCFIHMLVQNFDKIKEFGCPVGTLTTELEKLSHVETSHAHQIMALFKDWLRGQFERLVPEKDCDALAMHLLAWSQGVATLSATFKDKDFVEREVEQACHWSDLQLSGAH